MHKWQGRVKFVLVRMGWEHREVRIAPQETGITSSRAMKLVTENFLCEVISFRDHTNNDRFCTTVGEH